MMGFYLWSTENEVCPFDVRSGDMSMKISRMKSRDVDGSFWLINRVDLAGVPQQGLTHLLQ